MTPSLYLIDVSALAYRSFYAFINRPLVNSKGEETSAIFGFVSAILRLLAERNPTHIAFVKDLKGPTWRHEEYTEYKAHRKPMPENLAAQLPAIDSFVDHCGLRTASLVRYEADDVMATLAVQGAAKGFTVYLVTRDKDLMQLVGPQIHLFEMGKQGQEAQVIGTQEVIAKWGVGPEKIVDFLSLVGDASDNVPGVKGIGEKGAAQLIAEFGSLEGIYQNLEKIAKPKLREKLAGDKENALLSKRLVTLHTELELPLGLDDLQCKGLEEDAVIEFLNRWDLQSLFRFLPNKGISGGKKSSLKVDSANSEISDKPKAASVVKPSEKLSQITGAESGDLFAQKDRPHTYTLIDSESALAAYCARLEKCKVLAVDTETTSLNVREAELVGICLSDMPHEGAYIPIGHADGVNVPLSMAQKYLKPILDDAQRSLIFHNAKYDLPIMERHGLLPDHLDTPMHVCDTMIAAYLGNPGERGISLDDLAMRYFSHAMIPISDLIGKGKAQISFAQVNREKAAEYGAEDADFTLQLWKIFEKDLREKHVHLVYRDLEMALLPVLMRMEARGVLIDVKTLKSLSKRFDEEIFAIEQKVYAAVGHEFNLGSPLQLGKVLYEEMGLKQGRKTKTGWSTDAASLERIEHEHEVIPLILEYRELSKLRSTYVEALPQQVERRSGRVHTSFSQTIAATGRLSSIDPNLQNIPIRTETGREIRRCFIAPPGKSLLVADYSQIELRLLAHFSADPALLDAYQNHSDIHTRTAAAIYGLPEAEVTSDMRRNAKTVNFGVLYGMGAQRLSQQLKIPMADAKRFIENYFKSYAGVNGWIDATVEKARRLGYVETISGRKRYLPDLSSDNRMLRENAERMAVNTPIQGTAADLIKMAMIRIDKRIREENLACAMILQVHDELVFEVDDGVLDAAKALVKEEMENALPFRVPIEVSIGIGPNWVGAKE